MQVVRRLWAVCVSVGIVFLTAFPSALAVDTAGWYSTLVLPSFALPDNFYTPVWAVVYLADIAALTSLFSKGVHGIGLYIPLAAGVLNAFWCYVFFRLNCLAASAVLLGVIVLYSALCCVADFRKDRFSSLTFLLKTVWFAYLFAVSVALKA